MEQTNTKKSYKVSGTLRFDIVKTYEVENHLLASIAFYKDLEWHTFKLAEGILTRCITKEVGEEEYDDDADCSF